MCEEFTSGTEVSNIKPMGWLDHTWLVVFENVTQNKTLMTSTNLIFSSTFFQPGPEAHQVLKDSDGFEPCFVILSINVEGLFFVGHSVALIP